MAIHAPGEVTLLEGGEDVDGFVEGHDDGIEGTVDALDDAAVVALVAGGIGADIELAGDGGFAQTPGVGDQGLDVGAYLFDILIDEALLAMAFFFTAMCPATIRLTPSAMVL